MIVDHIFPNIGGDVVTDTGTITELVRSQEKSHSLLLLAVAGWRRCYGLDHNGCSFPRVPRKGNWEGKVNKGLR